MIKVHREKAENSASCGYSDVIHGSLYMNLTTRGVLQGYYVTLSTNTDGIPVFHSSGYSFWPIYLVIYK